MIFNKSRLKLCIYSSNVGPQTLNHKLQLKSQYHKDTKHTPLGGSLVTFTEFCSTDTGKHLSGIELKNSLKSLCIIASGERNPLTTASILNIHEAAK